MHSRTKFQIFDKNDITFHQNWKFLVFPYNEHQVEDARKLANSLGMDRFLPVTSEREIEFYNTDTPELYEWPKQ